MVRLIFQPASWKPPVPNQENGALVVVPERKFLRIDCALICTLWRLGRYKLLNQKGLYLAVHLHTSGQSNRAACPLFEPAKVLPTRSS